MLQPHWPQSLFTSHRTSFLETCLCLMNPARKVRLTLTGCVIGISLISISKHTRKRGNRPRRRGIRLQHSGNLAKSAKKLLAPPRVYHLSWMPALPFDPWRPCLPRRLEARRHNFLVAPVADLILRLKPAAVAFMCILYSEAVEVSLDRVDMLNEWL